MPILKRDLPERIVLPCGTILDKRLSYIEGIGKTERQIKDMIRSHGGKYRVVDVLHRNLRRKTGLDGRLYKPTRWILTNVDIEITEKQRIN